MKTSVKHISDTKVKLTIKLDAEELAIAEKVATAKLAKDVQVPGFRKGKTPVDVAAKSINPNILQESTVENAVSKAISEAFIDSELQALDRPAVEITKFVPGDSLEFTAEVEILPKVKLGDYKKLKVEHKKITVSEDDVEEIIDRIRKGFSEHKSVDRSAESGDEVVIDFVGKRDGVAFEGGTAKDYHLNLGAGQFIPGFEEGIVGRKKGDVFSLDLTFPEDYHAADLKGAKVTFEVTLNEINEIVTPDMTDELAAKSGPFKTVDELKDDIKRELTSQKEREAAEKMKDELVGQLVGISSIPVPDILVADQMKSIEQDFVNNLAYQGASINQYLESKGFKTLEEWRNSEVHDVAVKRVKSGLALAELSKIEKVVASADELEAHVELYKQQYANNAEALKQFELPEVRRDISNRLVTEKTVDRLVELNK